MDAGKAPVKLVKVIRVLGRTGMIEFTTILKIRLTNSARLKDPEEVLRKFVWSSWTTPAEILFAT